MAVIDTSRQILANKQYHFIDSGSLALLSENSGSIISNDGASASVTANLPSISSVGPGIVYEFVVAENYTLDIYPNGSEKIIFTDAIGIQYSINQIYSDKKGSTLRILSCGDFSWYITSMTGKWTMITV